MMAKIRDDALLAKTKNTGNKTIDDALRWVCETQERWVNTSQKSLQDAAFRLDELKDILNRENSK